MISIGYIAWNPFQIIQFSNVIKKHKNSTIIIIDKGENKKECREQAKKLGCKYEFLKPKFIPNIDGAFDAVLFQSPFPNMEKLNHTKLVSLQYGLAKERHNYGEWRSLADMNLMYGQYSADKTEYFSPSYVVGNPKFENWNVLKNDTNEIAKIKRELGINESKKTILYMPTWGELGSFNSLVKPLSDLKNKYNVMIKMHHNNDARYKDWKKIAKQAGIEFLYDGESDQLKLLSVSDLVISDYSGAIFDAMHAEVPILLFHENTDEMLGVQKFDKSSLEYARREHVGVICSSSSELEESIEKAFTQSGIDLVEHKKLKNMLFGNTESSSSHEIINKLNKLVLGGITHAV